MSGYDFVRLGSNHPEKYSEKMEQVRSRNYFVIDEKTEKRCMRKSCKGCSEEKAKKCLSYNQEVREC